MWRGAEPALDLRLALGLCILHLPQIAQFWGGGGAVILLTLTVSDTLARVLIQCIYLLMCRYSVSTCSCVDTVCPLIASNEYLGV